MSKVERTRENILKCLCKNCPSYTFTCKLMAMPGNVILLIDTMNDDRLHAETMFCAYDKSQCISEQKGCSCSKCEVAQKYGLDKVYYCLESGGK